MRSRRRCSCTSICAQALSTMLRSFTRLLYRAIAAMTSTTTITMTTIKTMSMTAPVFLLCLRSGPSRSGSWPRRPAGAVRLAASAPTGKRPARFFASVRDAYSTIYRLEPRDSDVALLAKPSWHDGGPERAETWWSGPTKPRACAAAVKADMLRSTPLTTANVVDPLPHRSTPVDAGLSFAAQAFTCIQFGHEPFGCRSQIVEQRHVGRRRPPVSA